VSRSEEQGTRRPEGEGFVTTGSRVGEPGEVGSHAPWTELAVMALGRGEIAFLATLVVGEILAFGQNLIGGLGLSFLDTLRAGGLYVYAFEHVPIRLTASGSGVRGPFGSLSVALLTVTALAIWLLFRGAAAVGERAGGGVVRRVLWGGAVGLPFALLSFLLSFVVPVRFRISVFEAGTFGVDVSWVAALLWPLVIGVVVGLAGGLWSGRNSTWPWARRVGVAMAGAWWMFLASLGLSLIGLLVLGGLNPSATRAYLDRTIGGGEVGVDLLAHHALALPNQSLWVLVPSMGGCDRASGSARLARLESDRLLCYWRFPRHGDAASIYGRFTFAESTGRVVFTRAPWGYLLFLLVPAVATLIGGAWIGRRSDGAAQRAVRVGLAGFGFALLVAGGSVLAGVSVTLGGAHPTTTAFGPDPVAGGLLALGWGVAGGVLGALLFGGRVSHPEPAPEPVFTS